jgi:hypothetical protein
MRRTEFGCLKVQAAPPYPAFLRNLCNIRRIVSVPICEVAYERENRFIHVRGRAWLRMALGIPIHARNAVSVPHRSSGHTPQARCRWSPHSRRNGARFQRSNHRETCPCWPEGTCVDFLDFRARDPEDSRSRRPAPSLSPTHHIPDEFL